MNYKDFQYLPERLEQNKYCRKLCKTYQIKGDEVTVCDLDIVNPFSHQRQRK